MFISSAPNSIFVARIGDGKSKAEGSAEIASTKKDSTAIEKIVANANGDSTKTAQDALTTVHKNAAGDFVIINAAGDSVIIAKQDIANASSQSNPLASDSTVVAKTPSDSTTIVGDYSDEMSNPTAEAEVPETEDIAHPIANGSGGSESSSAPSIPNAKFEVQQNLLKIGYGQNIPVVFSIFHDLKDTTNAKVEFVVDNPQVKQLYSFPFLEDKNLDGIPSSAVGDKFYHSTWIPGLNSETFPQPGKHKLTFNLVKENQQLAQKTLEIEVLPKYELTGLTATDASRPVRIAKEGETLYLVAKRPTDGVFKSLPSRKVIYNSKCSTPANVTFWPDQPYWKINDERQGFIGSKFEKTAKNWPLLENYSQSIVNKVEVGAYGEEKYVNVEWLRENKRTTSVIPFNMKGPIDYLQSKISPLENQYKKLSEFFYGKAGKDNAKIPVTFEFKTAYYEYNSEDPSSRLYFKNWEQIVSGGIKAETSDFMIPGLSTPPGIDKVVKFGVFASINTGARFQMNFQSRALCTQTEGTLKAVKSSLIVDGGIKLGLKLELLPALKGFNVSLEAKGYVYAAIIGQAQFIYNLDTKKYALIGEIKTNPIVLGYSIKAKISTWELLDYKGECQLFDSFNIIRWEN